MIFLITYDTKAGALLELREFSDEARLEATRALKETQDTYLRRLDTVEIGLFEAASRATLERTHSRYFRTLAELGDDLGAGARRTS